MHTNYVAVVIRPEPQSKIDEQQLAYQLLLKLKTTQDRVRELSALTAPSAAEQAELTQKRLEVERDESGVEYLIELAKTFGITSYITN